MAFAYKTISNYTDQLNTASFYEQKDLDNVFSGSVSDYYFGNSEQDLVEFSIYDIEGNLQAWNYLSVNPIYNIVSRTYKDVDQKTLTYEYKRFDNSNYTVSFNRNFLLNLLTNLSASGITTGNNIVSYNFVRNIGSSTDYPLLITNISQNRKEIELSPTFNIDKNDNENVLVNLQLSAFCQKKILLRDIVNILVSKLEKYQIYAQSQQLIDNNKAIFALMKSVFGFKTDMDIIKFLNDTYIGYTKSIKGNDNQIIYEIFDGILNYLKNWIYTYYQKIVSVEDLQNEFKYIINKATESELNKLNLFFGNNAVNKEKITNFITGIFYDNFVKIVLDTIDIEYKNKFLGYLQNALNFGNGNFLTILNFKGYINQSGSPVLIVKLFDFLPLSVGLRDRCWVSNISIQPLIQKIVINVPKVRQTFKIAPPNFKVRVDSYVSNPVDFKSSNDLKLSDDVKNSVNFYKKETELNVDYSNFSNFILFSSAEIRVKLLLNKLLKVNSLNNKILQYQSSSISASSALSMSYAFDTSNAKKQINTIYDSFDGYEIYLNNLSFIQSGSNNSDYQDYINSAIEYDRDNKDSLVNNVPAYIVNDSDNSDYLIFLSMIGHHFDNLYLYINKFPILQYVSGDFSSSFNTASISYGSSSYVSSFANVLLEQFGWNPISSFDDLSIESMYLSGSNTISNDEKNKTLWNRILQNLPVIYKTKGTEECIRLIENIYGIPNNLLGVKEYGGNNLSTDDDSSYTFSKRYYFTKFNGNSTQILIPPVSPQKAIEFKFRVDSTHNYPQKVPVTLICDDTDSFKIKIEKDVKNGMGKFIVSKFAGLYEVVFENVPLFTGKIFNCLLNVVDLSEDFDYGTDAPPSLFKIRLTSVEDDRIVYDNSHQDIHHKDLIESFVTGSTIRVGNYFNTNNFYGNIDKINIWKFQLSDEAFLDHCKNFDGYNNYSPTSSYSDLHFRYSRDYPINLYTSSGLYPFYNANKYYSTLTASVYYFPPNTITEINCIPTSASIFPYQYDIIDANQNIKLNSAGPNKYKNRKINKATEDVVARLMPDERSVVPNTVTQDSNLIGVYISPFKTKEDDIIDFLGNYNLMNVIGDPNNIYQSSYDSLRQLRNDYNKNNLAEKVLYQEFLTLYKNYFDKSFFTTVRQLIPLRNKLIDGILIEPSVLERSKYKNQPIDSGIYSDLTANVFNKRYTSSAINIGMKSSSIFLDIPKNGNNTIGNTNNFKFNYVSDDAIAIRNSIFSISGSYTTFDSTGSLETYKIYNLFKPYNITSDNSIYYKTLKQYNLAKSDSVLEDGSNIDIQSYPVGHYSLKTRPCRTFKVNKLIDKSISSSLFVKSEQTIYTTVNEKGILDGTSPVEITFINRDRNLNSLSTN
jgi:hypothetical protein